MEDSNELYSKVTAILGQSGHANLGADRIAVDSIEKVVDAA
jgi:hypothetical protein